MLVMEQSIEWPFDMDHQAVVFLVFSQALYPIIDIIEQCHWHGKTFSSSI